MSLTNAELTSLYTTLAALVNGAATWEQVDNLVDTVAANHAAVLDLIEALTERIEALETAYLNHLNTYHSS